MNTEKLPFEIHRKILIKKEAKTDSKYQDRRDLNTLLNYGVININKPSGPTSHQISEYVKKIINCTKAGHSGSLDPKVTGVLPIAIGDASRIVHPLLKGAKEYIALMHLHDDIKKDKIILESNKFIGTINQLPPVRSAVKRQWRKRDIYYLKIMEIKDRDILFKVGCQAGTYIRKVCHDLGKALGTNAHMSQLVRSKVANYTDKSWHSLTDLKDAYLLYKEGSEKELKKIILPIESAIEHLAKVWVFDNAVDSICHGASLNIPGISKYHSNIKINDTIAILTLKDELIALGTALIDSESIKKQEKGTVIKLYKVFMAREVYPK